MSDLDLFNKIGDLLLFNKMSELELLIKSGELNLLNNSKGDICSICLDTLDERNNNISKTLCGHLFHVGCINEWRCKKKDRPCPICRSQEIEDYSKSKKKENFS